MDERIGRLAAVGLGNGGISMRVQFRDKYPDQRLISLSNGVPLVAVGACAVTDSENPMVTVTTGPNGLEEGLVDILAVAQDVDFSRRMAAVRVRSGSSPFQSFVGSSLDIASEKLRDVRNNINQARGQLDLLKRVEIRRD